jgi:hypothetical protein
MIFMISMISPFPLPSIFFPLGQRRARDVNHYQSPCPKSQEGENPARFRPDDQLRTSDGGVKHISRLPEKLNYIGHCDPAEAGREKRDDVAISKYLFFYEWDCFASLAMTPQGVFRGLSEDSC